MLSAHIDVFHEAVDHVSLNKGGELILSRSTKGRIMDSDSDSDSDNGGDSNCDPVKIPVYEGTSIVFRNDKLDHRV